MAKDNSVWIAAGATIIAAVISSYALIKVTKINTEMKALKAQIYLNSSSR